MKLRALHAVIWLSRKCELGRREKSVVAEKVVIRGALPPPAPHSPLALISHSILIHTALVRCVSHNTLCSVIRCIFPSLAIKS